MSDETPVVLPQAADEIPQAVITGGATVHGDHVAFNPRTLGGLQPGDGE